MFVFVCLHVCGVVAGMPWSGPVTAAAVGVVYRSRWQPEPEGWVDLAPLASPALCASFWVIEQGFIVSEANSKGHVNDRGSW